MKRSTKILLGVASFWPIVYGLFFIAFVVGVIVYTGAFQPRPLDVPTDERWSAAFKSAGVDPRLLANQTGAA